MGHREFFNSSLQDEGKQVVQTIQWFRRLLKASTAFLLWVQVLFLVLVVEKFEALFQKLEMEIPGLTRLLFHQAKFWIIFLLIAIGYLVVMFRTKILDQVAVLLIVQFILGLWIAFDVVAIYIPYFEMIGSGRLGGIE